MREINIRLNANRAKAVHTGIKIASGDKGIVFKIAVDELNTEGTVAKIVFKRSNGTSVEAGITEEEGVYSYKTLGNEFAVVGQVVADVKLYKEEERVSTCTFVFDVTADTMDGLGNGAAGYSDTLERMKAGIEETEQEMNALTDELQELYEDYTAAFGNVAPFNPRGPYSEEEVYEVRDLVTHDNASWVCYKNCTGATPGEDSDCWQKLVSEGGGGPAQGGDADTLEGHSADYFAPKEDLENYLPKKGGYITGAEAGIGSSNSETGHTWGLRNSKRFITEQVLADGTYRIRDTNNAKNIITSTVDGTNTFDGTASGNFPLTGGKVNGATKFVVPSSVDFRVINGASAFSSYTAYYNNAEALLGRLGFDGVGNPDFYDNNNAHHTFLHTGNKPSGSYTGNGDATQRTIQTGGIGSAMILVSDMRMCIIGSKGAIVMNQSNGTITAITSGVSFVSGNLSVYTTNEIVNANGVTYHYQVL